MSAKHLWEAFHQYYCNEGNYYSNECGKEYRSWEAFLEAEGDCDLDYNLLFRWDWNKKEKSLKLFWVGQRKGLYRYTVVLGMHPDEEESVRNWLLGRWTHLAKLWAPLSGVEATKEGAT